MIGLAVEQALIDARYAVDWVRDGAEAIACIRTNHYQILLLDLGLPGVNGLEVLREARRSDSVDPKIPILIVTARDAVSDRVQGLDSGADDYLVKPFAVAELLARVRVLCRRSYGSATQTITTHRIVLDLQTKHLAVDGNSLRLSKRESALMECLMRRPGAIVSRAALEDEIYGNRSEIESNVVEFVIHGLRKKFGQSVIKNVRGLGWYVEPDPEG